MDDPDRTIEALCRLPVDFHALGNVSPVDLVVRSGYPAVASQVTADRARRCLAAHPDWVDSWFVWSDDQRSSPAWWLAEKSATTYEVGYSDPKLERQEPPLVFDDRVRACAEFMVRAIASIEASRRRVEATRMPGESYLDAAVRLSRTRTN
jgi:hypothetical protein